MPRISNSFDYNPVRILRDFWLSAEGCSARSLGLSRACTSRVVLVRLEGKTVLCRTKTEDFDDIEIRHVVHDLGQLYLDVSRKPQIDDFGKDVWQLVLAGECRKCEDFPTCIACYEPASRSHFEEDEAWLRDYLRGLEGRVLDVGIGQGRYLEGVAAAIRAGRLVVHGIDPEPGVKWEDVQVFEGHIEDFESPDGMLYDHVLAIRSVHHIEALEVALERICAVLKPGGRLLIIESAALPLLRSKKHAELAKSYASGGFQHLRNWDSNEMLAFLGKRFHLEVLFHRPISPDTCDQWILVMQRLP